MTSKLRMFSLAVLCLAFSGASAFAGTVTFDFNSLASGASSTSIQTYMRTVLTGAQPGSSVNVTSGAVTDKTYNGDGHVVGACSGSTCTSTTLGTDTFVRNTSSAAGWSFTFSGILIDEISFKYEIFPDGSCTALTSTACGGAKNAAGIYPNQPDFTFSTNLGEVFHYYGLTPGSGTTGAPAGNPSASTYTHSPISGATATEKAPQLIGTFSSTTLGGVTTLTFMDWPATIGIDDLYIKFRTPTSTTAVPEPGTMLLLGSGVAAAYARRRRKQAAEQA